MNISEIFSTFTRGVADIELSRHQVEVAADRELTFQLDQKRLLAKFDDPNSVRGMHNMLFRDATTGAPIFYGFRDMTVDQAIEALVRHTNRQHQWFLAESYELFEEFVKHAYASMGKESPDSWPLKDFGNARWSEITAKDYDWFLHQAREKRDAPLSMLRQFRAVLPRLRHVEAQNRMDFNLLVAVTLVGQLRHRIVHAKGLIPDREQFAKDLVQKLGYSGKGMGPHLAFIEGALLIDKRDGSIHLLDVPAEKSSAPVQFNYDIFNGMLRFMLMYAHEVYLSLGGEPRSQFETPPSVGVTTEPDAHLGTSSWRSRFTGWWRQFLALVGRRRR